MDRKRYRRFILGRLTIGIGWTFWPYWRFAKQGVWQDIYGWWKARLGPAFTEIMVMPKAFVKREEI